MSKKAYSRTIQAGTHSLESDREIVERKLHYVISKRNDLTSIPEKVAGDKLCYRNWAIPDGSKLFPLHWRDRFVDNYYANAPEGPLLVDFVRFDYEIENAKIKAKVLHDLGYRYIYLTNETSETEAREQLLSVKGV